jgi:hypothetical protein
MRDKAGFVCELASTEVALSRRAQAKGLNPRGGRLANEVLSQWLVLADRQGSTF